MRTSSPLPAGTLRRLASSNRIRPGMLGNQPGDTCDPIRAPKSQAIHSWARSTRLRHARSDKHPTPTSVAHSPNCRKEYPHAAYTSNARSKSVTWTSLRTRCHALSLTACSCQLLGNRFSMPCQSSSFQLTPCSGAALSVSCSDDDIGPPENR